MSTCAYCQLPSSASIPANPGRVCVTHAIEFWTAFLAFAKQARLEAPALTVPARARPFRAQVLKSAVGTDEAKEAGRPTGGTSGI
jgi:hypothetical protein